MKCWFRPASVLNAEQWCAQLHWQEAWWKLSLEQQPLWFLQVWGSCHLSGTRASVFVLVWSVSTITGYWTPQKPPSCLDEVWRCGWLLPFTQQSVNCDLSILLMWSPCFYFMCVMCAGWCMWCVFMKSVYVWHIQLLVVHVNRTPDKVSVFSEIWCPQKTKSFNSSAFLKNNSGVSLTLHPLLSML